MLGAGGKFFEPYPHMEKTILPNCNNADEDIFQAHTKPRFTVASTSSQDKNRGFVPIGPPALVSVFIYQSK
jgi:hypothetical protein